MFKTTQTNTVSYIKDGKYVFYSELNESIDGKNKTLRYTVERDVNKNFAILSQEYKKID